MPLRESNETKGVIFRCGEEGQMPKVQRFKTKKPV